MNDRADDCSLSPAEADFLDLQANAELRALFKRCESDEGYQEMKKALHDQGTKGLEPYFAEYRTCALAKAELGDMGDLAELIRAGTVLNDRERQFAADYMLGNINRSPGPRRKQVLTQQICLVFFWLNEVDGWKVEAATEHCTKLFGLTRGQVFERRSQGKKCMLTQECISQRRTALKFTSPDITNYFRMLDLKSG